MISLLQTIEIMKKVKDNDFNDELEVYVENGHFVIKEKLITIGGYHGN